MGNTNVRVISAAQGGNQGIFETVNVATDALGDIPAGHQACQQMTGATGTTVGIPGTIPSVIAGPTGAMSGLPNNGLRTIVISGYTGPS